MRYIPNSPEERAEMLHQIGLEKPADLFATVPEQLRLTRDLDTPAALSELELLTGFERMAVRNTGAQRASFLGGGAGSPSGVAVYEGTLLPRQYHGTILHADPGPSFDAICDHLGIDRWHPPVWRAYNASPPTGICTS